MIQNSSMLIDLNISVWTGRKMDKKVSEEIDASKGTHARAGNYHKKLLAGTQKLNDLTKLVERNSCVALSTDLAMVGWW